MRHAPVTTDSNCMLDTFHIKSAGHISMNIPVPSRYHSALPRSLHLRLPGFSARAETLQTQASTVEITATKRSNDSTTVRHLMVMVHGLLGSPSNWEVVVDKLQTRLSSSASTICYTSNANSFFKTFDGIDVCGERLADEVREVVRRHAGLQQISFLGHSMGGLLARHAIGHLYNPETGLICGLQPTHFVTLATPHLGCAVMGPAQVPLIGWMTALPHVGGPLQSILSSIAAPVTAIFLSRTGQQFFLQDGSPTDPTSPPLLLRMTQDSTQDACYLSALAAFQTRTCYANMSGDHLVGYFNSSLRWPEELTTLQIPLDAPRRGVVRADHLAAAFTNPPGALQTGDATACQDNSHPKQTGGNGFAVGVGSSSGGLGVSRSGRQYQEGGAAATASVQQQPAAFSGMLSRTDMTESDLAAQERAVEANPQVSSMLTQLRSLPWRRVDVCFRESSMPLLAHNHIQVTRKLLNMEGEGVVMHLVEQLTAMDTALGCDANS